MYLLINPFHPTSYLNYEINKFHLYNISYDCEILQTMNSLLSYEASNPLIRSLSSILILIFCTTRFTPTRTHFTTSTSFTLKFIRSSHFTNSSSTTQKNNGTVMNKVCSIEFGSSSIVE